MTRPVGIWIVVGLQIALAISLLPSFAQHFPGVSPISGIEMDDIGRAIYVGYAIVAILAALWLWTLSRRGWVLTMVLVGIGLIANLVLWSLNDPHFVRMAILSATALYLNSAPIRDLFMVRQDVSRMMLRDTEGV